MSGVEQFKYPEFSVGSWISEHWREMTSRDNILLEAFMVVELRSYWPSAPGPTATTKYVAGVVPTFLMPCSSLE